MKLIVTVDADSGAVLETYGPVPDTFTLPDAPGRVRLNRPMGEDTKFKRWNGAAFETLAPAPVVSPIDFARLFTQQERIAIRERSQTGDVASKVMSDFYAMLELAGEVNLLEPDVIAGLGLLQALGLISDKRKAQILANERPNG